jgi:hypothetical protein
MNKRGGEARDWIKKKKRSSPESEIENVVNEYCNLTKNDNSKHNDS